MDKQSIEAFILLNDALSNAEGTIKELANRIGELETGMDIVMDILTTLKEEK